MTNDKLAVLIKKTALVIEKLSNQELTPYELTNTQFRILMLLYRNPEKSIRQTDIETKFAMTNPTVTGIVNNLEKKNLIRRFQNPEDKRSKLIALTEQAFALKDELYAVSDRLDEQIARNLTPEEYEQLGILLKKMLNKK